MQNTDTFHTGCNDDTSIIHIIRLLLSKLKPSHTCICPIKHVKILHIATCKYDVYEYCMYCASQITTCTMLTIYTYLHMLHDQCYEKKPKTDGN